MNGYIEAEKLWRTIAEMDQSSDGRLLAHKTGLLDMIYVFPKEDVAPAVHAHWIVEREEVFRSHAKCSHCGKRGCEEEDWSHEQGGDLHCCTPFLTDYCPSCGARMDGQTEEHSVPTEEKRSYPNIAPVGKDCFFPPAMGNYEKNTPKEVKSINKYCAEHRGAEYLEKLSEMKCKQKKEE